MSKLKLQGIVVAGSTGASKEWAGVTGNRRIVVMDFRRDALGGHGFLKPPDSTWCASDKCWRKLMARMT